MKKIFRKWTVLLATVIIGFSHPAPGQAIYRIQESKDINMKLSGTSTLHKWEMKAKTFTGEAQFCFDSDISDELTSLQALTFSLEVENLKSKEKALDKNAYKALKANEYREIIYQLLWSKVLHKTGNKYLIEAHGNLTIAGITRAVTMDVSCIVNKNSTITCTGSEKLKMSDYKINPPSFMMGAMKTGDEITLDFILVYKKENKNDKLF